MLEEDLTKSKSTHLTENQVAHKKLKDVLFKYYKQIKNIYLLLSSTSTYPKVDFIDATEFARRSNILDNDLNIARMEQLFIEAKFS